jgi:hypothetical protein
MSALSVTKQDVAPRCRMPRALGGEVAVVMHVRHDVMPKLTLVVGDLAEVDLLSLGAKLGNLLLANVEPELALALCQCDPEIPPDEGSAPGREEFAHGLAGIARDERVLVGVVGVVHPAQDSCAGDADEARQRADWLSCGERGPSRA